MEPRTVFVAESGDLAYDFGSFKMVIEGPEGRTEIPQKSTIIWRKFEGQWKCVVMTFSSDMPPAPKLKTGMK
jgi:ketosteroid isomerase-like protein